MSLQVVQQKSDQYRENNQKLREQLKVLDSKINEVDITSPDAISQLNNLSAEKQAAISDWNQNNLQLNIEISQITSTLPETERTQAEAAIAQNNADSLATRQQSFSTDQTFTNKQEKIQSGSNETNPSQSDKASQEKISNTEVVSATTSGQENVDAQTSYDLQATNQSSQTVNGIGRNVPLPAGAIPVKTNPANVTFKNISGEEIPQDTRVKIRVPKNYITILTKGPGNKNGVLGELGGIIFPYTPSIGYEHKADYASSNPIHSNFTQYFYRSSSVSPINISGKFSVANEYDAMVYLATVHLLRALVKMRFGGSTGDFDSGAPPPVCRLDAYGTFMLQNVPVVISSYKVDLPETVDYYTLRNKGLSSLYEKTAVPVLSTISVNCLPIYSRNEIQKFSVTSWLNETSSRKAGYL